MTFPIQGTQLRLVYAAAFMIMLNSAASAQVKLSGTITDASGAPIPSANVILVHAGDSSMVKGVVTTLDGKYTFTSLDPGRFLLISSMVGYKKSYSPAFDVRSLSISMPPEILTEEINELTEVVVRAQKPLYEQQMDKLVVNIENSITSAGNTVLEVLQRSPGITVNKQSNTISLAGRQGLQIMINGKIQRLPMETIVQMFSGMNANNIERIEIISNPSSKYEAQGDAGIINIITKQSPDIGTNGSYSLAAGYGYYEKLAGSFNINHRTKFYNIFADYSVSYNKTWQDFRIDWNNSNQGQSTNTTSIRYPVTVINRASVGAEFYVSQKTTIGTLISAFDDKWEMTANNSSSVDFYGVPTSTVLLTDNEINQWKNFMGNINLRHTFSGGKALTVDADYLYYLDNNPHQYSNQFYYFANDSTSLQWLDISKKTPINMGIFKADYEQAIGKMKLESGIKGIFSRLNNTVIVQSTTGDKWMVDTKFSQDYAMKDDVLAAYANLSFPINEKTKMQIGLRTEHTDMKIRDAKDSMIFNLEFWSLFPSLFFTRQINKDNALQFSFGQRITRPSYSDIAPFVVFLDPYTYFSGNPRLQPTQTTNFQGTYTYKELILAARYSIDKHYIANFQSRVDPTDNKTYYYSANLDRVDSYSLSLSFPIKVREGWEIQNNMLGLYQTVNSDYLGKPVTFSQVSGQFNSTSTTSFGKGYAVEVSGTYWTPALFGVGKQLGFGEVTAGLQKKLNDNKGTFRINISDIFWTNVYRFTTEIPSLNLDQHGSLRFEPRVVRISFTKNFGRSSVKTGKRATGSEAEQGRVK